MSNLAFGRRRVALPSALADLQLNLSYVLHERSDSAAVSGAAAACQRHAARVPRLHVPVQPATIDGALPDGVDVWLTATLGVPHLLPNALRSVGVPTVQMMCIDVGEGLAPPGVGGRIVGAVKPTVPLQSQHPPIREGLVPPLQVASFFRAPATLALPGGAACVGVAALLLRPGERTTQLTLSGPFVWPDEEAAVLRALERLVQAHVEQWTPPRAVWEVPAELAPDGEVT